MHQDTPIPIGNRAVLTGTLLAWFDFDKSIFVLLESMMFQDTDKEILILVIRSIHTVPPNFPHEVGQEIAINRKWLYDPMTL